MKHHDEEPTAGQVARKVGQATGLMTGAYHGYRRNKSVGSAVGWAVLGSLFWPITIPVSLAQGYGKPKKK